MRDVGQSRSKLWRGEGTEPYAPARTSHWVRAAPGKSRTLGKTASASPGSLLQMSFSGPTPDLLNLERQGWGPVTCSFVVVVVVVVVLIISNFNYYLFIYLFIGLCWVFVSVRGLSLVAASGGHSSSRCAGLSLSRPLLLQSTGSRRASSVVVAHGPSCSAACGIFPDQGLNPCPLH